MTELEAFVCITCTVWQAASGVQFIHSFMFSSIYVQWRGAGHLSAASYRTYVLAPRHWKLLLISRSVCLFVQVQARSPSQAARHTPYEALVRVFVPACAPMCGQSGAGNVAPQGCVRNANVRCPCHTRKNLDHSHSTETNSLKVNTNWKPHTDTNPPQTRRVDQVREG